LKKREPHCWSKKERLNLNCNLAFRNREIMKRFVEICMTMKQNCNSTKRKGGRAIERGLKKKTLQAAEMKFKTWTGNLSNWKKMKKI